MLLTIIIPVYNEEKTIEELINTVFKVALNKEVILINDGSSNQTKDIIDNIEQEYKSNPNLYPYLENLRIINKINKGKGSAIKVGYQIANGDIIIIQDADLELDPNDYSILVAPFKTMDADIVFGSRFLNNKKINKTIFYYGNIIITKFSNLFTGIKMTDVETCYKVFKKEVVQSFNIKSDGFSIDPELAAYTGKAVRNGKLFYEVPVSYSPRNYLMGKKIKYLDGVRAIFSIIRYNLLP